LGWQAYKEAKYKGCHEEVQKAQGSTGSYTKAMRKEARAAPPPPGKRSPEPTQKVAEQAAGRPQVV